MFFFKVNYIVTIFTGRKTNESSSGHFEIKFFGKYKNSTLDTSLTSSLSSLKQRVNSETHELKKSINENCENKIPLSNCYDVDEIEEIKIYYPKKSENSWFIERIVVEMPMKNIHYE